MRLWEKYKSEMVEDALVDGVPDWLVPAVYEWIDRASARISEGSHHTLTVRLKAKFRVELPLRHSRLYSQLFINFLQDLAVQDGEAFFAVVDYLIGSTFVRFEAPPLGRMLNEAGHKYTVYETDGNYFLGERLPEEQRSLMGELLTDEVVYKSEFKDAFVKIYGRDPNYTDGTGEAFQALESALKYYFGDDKGANLGALVGWLRDNPSKWEYKIPSEAQKGAEAQFLTLADFVNQSYRAIKHGHAAKKLEVEKEQAETVLRAVSLLLFELEHAVALVE